MPSDKVHKSALLDLGFKPEADECTGGRVITEARALRSAQHHSKRIDLVMTDQNRLPTHGVEALICGSVECVQEHFTRAASIYQPLYSQQSDDGRALPSTIQVGPCV